MAELWYFLAAGMVAAWATLDGFSLGAGALSRWAAQTDGERRSLLSAIGPFWDGSEVCLLAAGGTLLLAFPKAMTAGFSGFYLPLFFLVWALIGRGLSIELRSHLQDPLWRTFWDFIFWVSSALLPLLAGTALGNVMRGVPLDASGYFSLPLFGDLTPTGRLGVLDGYTVLIGAFTLALVSAHGAMFLRWKTTGDLYERANRAARRLWPAVLVLWTVAMLATFLVTPLGASFATRPLAWAAFGLPLLGLGMVWRGLRPGHERLGFLGSSAVIVGILFSAAASAFPVLLHATTDPALSLTLHNSTTHPGGLSTALSWWIPAFLLACAYFVYVFRTFRGTVS